MNAGRNVKSNYKWNFKMKPIIYPYNMGSKSAKALADILRTKRVYPDGNYYHHPRHLVINWGNSIHPNWFTWSRHPMLNYPDAVARSVNKLLTFNELYNMVSIPQFTTSKEEALSWLGESIVVCRTTLTGHSGQGIVLAENSEQLVDAPLYTRHVRHKREFRVHVFRQQVIDFSEKKRNSTVENAVTLVRNHDNGWIYAREEVALPTQVKEEAVKAVEALGLHFGAVDVGYRVADNKAFVFEVNTSPGLEGQTLINYAKAFAWEIYNGV